VPGPRRTSGQEFGHRPLHDQYAAGGRVGRAWHERPVAPHPDAAVGDLDVRRRRRGDPRTAGRPRRGPDRALPAHPSAFLSGAPLGRRRRHGLRRPRTPGPRPAPRARRPRAAAPRPRARDDQGPARGVPRLPRGRPERAPAGPHRPHRVRRARPAAGDRRRAPARPRGRLRGVRGGLLHRRRAGGLPPRGCDDGARSLHLGPSSRRRGRRARRRRRRGRLGGRAPLAVSGPRR